MRLVKQLILCLALCLSSECFGVIAFSTSCSNETASGTSLSCSAAVTVPSNGFVVIVCDVGTTGAVTISATDEAATSYTSLGANHASGDRTFRAFGAFYVSGASHTPKCTHTATATFMDMTSAVYTGTATSSFQDGSEAFGSGSGTAFTTSTSITPSVTGDVLIEYGSSSDAGSPTVSSPWTRRDANAGGGIALADNIRADTTAVTGAMTGPAPGTWGLYMVAIKPPGGATAAGFNKRQKLEKLGIQN